MDVKKSKLNVAVSIGFKIITMIVSLVTRSVLVNICGNEINGLNALYLSIIGFLSVVELGVGGAITFCMYKPIVENDIQKVGALYNIFRKAYLGIGTIIFAGGLLIMPFLKFLAKDYSEIDVNIYLTFLLMLISVTATYLFSAKTSLINAYKNNYISTTISQGGLLFQHTIQIVVLYMTQSFVWYLVCRIITVVIQCVCTDVVVHKKYGNVIKQNGNIDEITKKELKKNIAAMFMHKIGSILVNTVDNVIISAFVGVIALGEYSNYAVIMSAMVGVITMIFTSLTSVIGHLYVEEDIDTTCRYCDVFHTINFIIATVFFLGYYAIIDCLVALLFSPELVVDRNITFVITVNGFVQYMRQSVLVFKDATGMFYKDRWKPIIEGVVNIILSIFLVKTIGVVGVIVATIITNLMICHVVEPYVLYKYAFCKSPQKYYFKNYSMILEFVLVLSIYNIFMFEIDNNYIEIIINGCESLAFSAIVVFSAFITNSSQKKFFYKLIIKEKGYE